jgi:hypothetical protein
MGMESDVIEEGRFSRPGRLIPPWQWRDFKILGKDEQFSIWGVREASGGKRSSVKLGKIVFKGRESRESKLVSRPFNCVSEGGILFRSILAREKGLIM